MVAVSLKKKDFRFEGYTNNPKFFDKQKENTETAKLTASDGPFVDWLQPWGGMLGILAQKL